MKKQFVTYLVALIGVTACGSMAQLSPSAQQFEDGIYTIPVKPEKRSAAQQQELDALVRSSRTSEVYVQNTGSDTLVVPPGEKVRLQLQTEQQPDLYTAWDFGWTTPWAYPAWGWRPLRPYGWYGPWSLSFRDPWFYDPWFYDPWYYDPWLYGSACPFGMYGYFGRPAYWGWDPYWYGGYGPMGVGRPMPRISHAAQLGHREPGLSVRNQVSSRTTGSTASHRAALSPVSRRSGATVAGSRTGQTARSSSGCSAGTARAAGRSTVYRSSGGSSSRSTGSGSTTYSRSSGSSSARSAGSRTSTYSRSSGSGSSRSSSGSYSGGHSSGGGFSGGGSSHSSGGGHSGRR